MAARGIIISLSILFAAGLAVYENPQVREWIDQHRQKIAVSLQSWGEGEQSQADRRRTSRAFDDASSKEDISPEATERRRKYQQELAERRRVLSEKSGRSTPHTRRGSSFDDIVDVDGNLRASTSGAARAAGEAALRRRAAGTAGMAAGAVFANPFGDEMQLEPDHERVMNDEELARQLQATFDREAREAAEGPISPMDEPLTDEELAQFKKHMTLFEDHEQATRLPQDDNSSRPQALTQRELDEFQRLLEAETGRSGVEEVRRGTHGISEQELLRHLRELEGPLIDIDESGRRTPTATTTAPSIQNYPHTPGTGSEVLVNATDAASTHPSEAQLVDLTPTTSAPGTPRQLPRQPVHQPSYQSIQDWAEQSTASFRSLPDEAEIGRSQAPMSRTVSAVSALTSSVHAPSEVGGEGDLVSELGASTPGTWTEVGSVVSADDYEQHSQQR